MYVHNQLLLYLLLCKVADIDIEVG